MTQHTPGPWYVMENAATDSLLTIQAQAISGNGEWRIGSVANTNKPTGQANARLIAAAPELLLALQSLENFVSSLTNASGDQRDKWLDREWSEMNRIDFARAAIAKAIGESNGSH